MTLDSKQIDNLDQVRLQNDFAALVLAVTAARGEAPQKDMVVFASYYPEPFGDTQLHHHYFSPGCLPETKALIEQYGGVECERPSTENLAFFGDLHYGDPWDLVGGPPGPPPRNR